MSANERGTEFGARIVSVTTGDGFIEVVLSIRGNSKTCRSEKPEIIESVSALNLFSGEKVRLLYTSPNDWTVRRNNNPKSF